jgi:hypothetical protein
VETDARALWIARTLSGVYNPSADILAAVRRTLPSAPTEGFHLAKEAAALIQIMRGGGAYEAKKQAMRVIGEAVYAAYGFEGMQDLATEVRHQFPSGEGGEDGWHPAHIDSAWNGVGPWLA